VIFLLKKHEANGIIFLGLLFSAIFSVIMGHYFIIASSRKYSEAFSAQGTLKINVECGNGNIYDTNMQPLVNQEQKYIAVVVPELIDADETAEYAADKEDFFGKYSLGEPFSFECSIEPPESDGITVFSVPKRYSENQLAQHIIGYTADDVGVCGIEYAYDSILRSNFGENSVTYSIDGYGDVLLGEEPEITRCGEILSGAVLTIDSEIQKICEDAGNDIDKGAIIVTEVKTGNILGLASFPDYSVYDLESAVNSPDSPMINRAFYSYSVGSVFKLVTACEAIQSNLKGYVYSCNGAVDILGQSFRCHKTEGHGLQTMTDAMVNSCNTYFISLSRLFDAGTFRETAYNLGFGREIYLCSGMTASGGVLPSEEDLSVPAELANFSFGQGKLTASPLQISRLTCAIANNGEMPVLRLIRGITYDGETVENEKNALFSEVMDSNTANQLKEMMISAVYENESSNARPDLTSAGVKTSTAQTGNFDSDGNEQYNAWITGFFPAYNPEYAVTVLIEDGGYGNDSAAPVFKEIADAICLAKSL
jgi:penicillin-binding protein 2